jgi:hypothetical protein
MKPATTRAEAAPHWISCLRSEQTARLRLRGRPTRAGPQLDCELRQLRRPARVRAQAGDPWLGYDGYPSHGSPRTCRGDCPAHIHVSWVSGCYGSSALVTPCAWVMAFPVPSEGDTGEDAGGGLEANAARFATRGDDSAGAG